MMVLEYPFQRLGQRLRQICTDINNTYDVDGLCTALPKRIEALEAAEGDRIRQ